ncbi:TPA: hypothetical protein ACH3X2_010884 [Trebouxia sp. C0005]
MAYVHMPQGQLAVMVKELKDQQRADASKIDSQSQQLINLKTAELSLAQSTHNVLTRHIEQLKLELSQAQAATATFQQQAAELPGRSSGQQIEAAAQMTAADASCAAAGLSDVLLNLARAVRKGHLKPEVWIAQSLATTSSNLCQNSTTSWVSSASEHCFFSLMRKTSRAAVELSHGVMHAGCVPSDFAIFSAVMNEVVPSRQATQQWDAKFAASGHFQTMDVNSAMITHLAHECGRGSDASVETCLGFDATDVAPSVMTSASGQSIQWHGHHDVASFTGIQDPQDQAD